LCQKKLFAGAAYRSGDPPLIRIATRQDMWGRTTSLLAGVMRPVEKWALGSLYFSTMEENGTYVNGKESSSVITSHRHGFSSPTVEIDIL
jgi:hypothetical protein